MPELSDQQRRKVIAFHTICIGNRLITQPHKPPRKHHYLPIFLSRQWTDQAGELQRYVKGESGIFTQRRVHPARVGYERDLYTIPGVSPELAQRLEQEFFSGHDNEAAVVLRELLEGRIPKDASTRSTWARFIMGFWYRAPEDLAALKETWQRVDDYLFRDHVRTAEQQERAILLMLPRLIDNAEMGQHMINMDWFVVDVSNADHELLTSDQPTIRSNGLAPPEGNYSLALSPTKLFAMASRGLSESFLRLSPSKQVRIANKMTVQRARRFVLAHSNSQAMFIERHFGQDPVPSPAQSMLDILRQHPDAIEGLGVTKLRPSERPSHF